MHGSGANKTSKGRKCLLSAFQLGWLRPEYKFWAHKELHQVSLPYIPLSTHQHVQDPCVELCVEWAGIVRGKTQR
jgi:hypothetical protein